MPDRTQRLLAVLPAVDRALAEERNFLDRAKDVWTDLRRGLLDVKQDPEQLEGMRLPDGNSMDNLWEFIMKLVAASPKHTKQVLEVLPVLLTPATPRWADAFRRTPGKGRLSLWRLAASPASQAEFDKVVDVTLQLLALKVPADELLPSEEVAAAPDFVRELLGRARAQGGVAWEGLRASGLGALRLEGGAETERAAESNAAAEPEAFSNAAAGEAWTPSPATLAAAEAAAASSAPPAPSRAVQAGGSPAAPFGPAAPPTATAAAPPPPAESGPPVPTQQGPFAPPPRADARQPVPQTTMPPGPGAPAAPEPAAAGGPPPGASEGMEEVLRWAQPFLQLAGELEPEEPVAAYFCRTHALEALVPALVRARKVGVVHGEAQVLAELELAEGQKRRLDLSGGHGAVQRSALRAFQEAQDADGAGAGDAADRLLAAGCRLDVLAQFHDGVPPPAAAARAQYARARAVHLRRCRREGASAGRPAPPAFAPLRGAEEAEERERAKLALARAEAEAQALAEERRRLELAQAQAQAQALADERRRLELAQAQAQAQAEAQARARAAAAPAPAPAGVALGGRVPEAAGWSASKRQAEAKKRCDNAVGYMDATDPARAREAILQALELIEGQR